MNFQSFNFNQETIMRCFSGYHYLPGISFSNSLQFPIYKNLSASIPVIRTQDFELANMQTKSEESLESLKFEPEIKFEQLKQESSASSSAKIEVAENLSVLPIESSPLYTPLNYEKFLKAELENMLNFILCSMEEDNQVQIENARNFYRQSSNPCLIHIFNKLVIKYHSAKKGKEDIIRYIFRKAFKFIKTSIMKSEKVNSKKASVLFCKRYLPLDATLVEQLGDDIANEEKLFEVAMSGDKKSNKTMNTKFVLEIFKSSSFFQAYINFLPELDKIVVEDNIKRKQKFVDVLLQCIQKNDYSKIGSFPRLPWLDVWVEDTKNLAIAIMPGKRLIYNNKKPKY